MDLFKNQVALLLSKYTKLPKSLLFNLIEIPPNDSLGDYSFPCFILSKQFKKNPNEIAKDISIKIKSNNYIKEINVEGPYINFFVNPKKLIQLSLSKILKEKDKFGRGNPKKEKVMIEFSQPNTHKEFHIGHLRNVCLGDSLVRIFRFNGYKTIAANYIGDIGNHVAKCLWIYLRNYKNKEPKNNRGAWLGKLYSEATSLVEDNLEFKDEVQEIQRQLEAGNKELIQLWKKSKEWSLNEFNNIYRILNVNFDICFFESEVEKEGKDLAKELLKNKIAELNEGAVLVNLEKYKLGIFLILKSDGTSLYSTKDLALAKTKFTKFKIDKSIHIVADEQKLYFQQLFKTLDLMGFEQAKKCCHLPYALVMLQSGKMSSRQGNVIKFMDLYEEVLSFTLKETKSRHPNWSNKKIEEISHKICIASIKFPMVSQDNNKVIIFDKLKSTSFEGETGPYIQYTYARISSILKKYKSHPSLKTNFSLLNLREDINIAKLLQNYPITVEKATENFKPSIITRFLLDLSQAFNEYYHKYKILQDDKELEDARILLIFSIQSVLRNGMNLIGMECPDEM